MNKEALKKQAAEAALSLIGPQSIVGVGSGSTVNYFLEVLSSIKNKLDGVVCASLQSTQLAKKLNLPIIELNSVSEVPVYVDGADEFNLHHFLIKGGGGALTREKIIASCSQNFICIVDESKQVDVLGKFPVAIEVIPMARSFAGRQLTKLGGSPEYREGFVTDNGNVILDVYNLSILDPTDLEKKINNIPGVVCNGIFALRKPEKIIVATNNGIKFL